MPWPSDPALPHLPLLRDLDAVSAVLPGWRATSRLHLRYVPGRSCVATYHLEAHEDAGPPSIGVVSVRPDVTDVHLYVDDPALPGLATVVDGRASGRRLGLDDCAATPVRYRPGARCTVALSQDSTVVAFAKVLPGAERLRAAVDLFDEAGVAVAAVEAWWPDLGCLVQRAVRSPVAMGHVLPERPVVVAEAGVALARLHAVRRPAGAAGLPEVRLDDDLAGLARLRAPVAAAVPESLGAYDAALEAVASFAARDAGPAAPSVPSHGAFRAGQVVLDGDGRAVVLDLDGACCAEPGRDVGNFLAYLRWQALRLPAQAPAVTAAREAFQEGYRSVAPPLDGRRVALHEAASLVKIAGRRARDLSTEEWPLLPALLAQVDLVLGASRGS
jgi:hypothetical protein